MEKNQNENVDAAENNEKKVSRVTVNNTNIKKALRLMELKGRLLSNSGNGTVEKTGIKRRSK